MFVKRSARTLFSKLLHFNAVPKIIRDISIWRNFRKLFSSNLVTFWNDLKEKQPKLKLNGFMGREFVRHVFAEAFMHTIFIFWNIVRMKKLIVNCSEC